MILLVTSSARAQDCAAALDAALGERVELVEDMKRATVLARAREYTAVVLDQVLVDSSPELAETVLRRAATAVPVIVNFAISGLERLVMETRAALQRRQREELEAQRAAVEQLRSEVMQAITGILLSSELALAEPALPPSALERLRSVRDLANDVRVRLQPAP